MLNFSSRGKGVSYPRQKLSETQKTEKWLKENLDYAEGILDTNNTRTSIYNKKINQNLRANIIHRPDIEKFFNVDKFSKEYLPDTFQHIGIENNKINLLLGEYYKRRTNFKAYLSSNDDEAISSKEKKLLDQINQFVIDKIKNETSDPQQLEKELKKLETSVKTYQSIGEITANKILKKEYKQQNLKLNVFLKTFEDLLVNGEEVAYVGELGGEPVVRRINPKNVFGIGSDSPYLEDCDIIAHFDYYSLGQVIDDYWDELKEEDIKYLESLHNEVDRLTSYINPSGARDPRSFTMQAKGSPGDAYILLGPEDISHFNSSRYFDGYGNIRVLRVCWRTRRKIGKLTTINQETGEEETDWVNEFYKADEVFGEKIEWVWVNEWMEGTKIGENVYCKMRPVPYAGKSLVNKSKGTPPFVGIFNGGEDKPVSSLMDIMKPLSYTYDITYYKRELAIATHTSPMVAINSSMIPSGWDAEKWIAYAKINRFMFLNPAEEIRKGPAQGKTAGNFNQLTASVLQIDNSREVQMYTDLLFNIEETMGKLAGISGAREGQIQNREAVGNVEREVTQTSHITEIYFALDSEFQRRVLTKFLEVCKYCYKKNPSKGVYILDDLSQEFINNYDEFLEAEYDIHISDSSMDEKLFQDLKTLIQPAIQNGQATILDAISLYKAESIQEIAKKLEDSSKRIAEQQQEAQQIQNQMEQERQKAEQLRFEAEHQLKREIHEGNMEIQRETLEIKRELGYLSEGVKDRDSQRRLGQNYNGIADEIDSKILDVQKQNAQNNLEKIKKDKEIKEKELQETIRHNKEQEKIDRLKIQKQKAR